MSRRQWTRALVVGCVIAASVGCSETELDSTYGKRRGSPGAESVNGTSVLAAMFEAAGHRVTTWRRLSPKLEQADAIVWFPDSFSAPRLDERTYLESWLNGQPGRTLIFIGRDYDAAIEYWKTMQPIAPPEQTMELARRAAVAQAVFDKRRSAMPSGESRDWFHLEPNHPRRTVSELSGPWAADIDGKRANIQLNSRFALPSDREIQEWLDRNPFHLDSRPEYERLLYSGDDPLVTRFTVDEWLGSQLLVVTNGSFLLNMPLVNHEHRKLAAKLVNACGPSGKVVFLESGEAGLEIFDTEPGANAPTGFEVFTVWPIGVILIHLTALGMLACFTLFPIFGRPRELPAAASADFGQHITALGALLERTGDKAYAESRLQQYHEQTKHKSQAKRQRRR